MNTLTIQLPDSIDPETARWELARSLYEKEQLTLEEAAKVAGLAPVYFKKRLENRANGPDPIRQELVRSAKPFNREHFNKLIDQMDIQESWENLVAMIGK